MPIEHVNGISGIRDNQEENQQAPSLEHSQVEALVLDYLLQNYDIGYAEAHQILGAIMASGEDLIELLFQLQLGDQDAIARIETFVYQLG